MSNASYFSIKIEGDFVDSFLYSGTLFLVHADARITTHSWESLLDSAIEENWGSNADRTTIGFLKDCRRKFAPTELNRVISIENAKLIEHQKCSLQLNGWPTDINIYSNKFYIANEDGVDELKFDHETRCLESESRFTIYNKYAYKISPNDGHRIAIAAGANGVVAAYPRTGYIKQREDIAQLIDVDAHDCEWIGENLAANSLSGAFLLTFPELPKRPVGVLPPDYWTIYNKAKKEPPVSQRIASEADGSNPYIWVAGGKIFKLYETGDLLIEGVEKNSENIQRNHLEFVSQHIDAPSSESLFDGRILAARTSLFGTVAEIGDFLYSITEDGIEITSHRPVSWRVFPRAKSYLNQLHIVENDSLVIRAYMPQNDDSKINRFGITFDEAI